MDPLQRWELHTISMVSLDGVCDCLANRKPIYTRSMRADIPEH